MLSFALQHGIYDSSATTPRAENLRPRAKLTPKTKTIEAQKLQIAKLRQETEAAREISKALKRKLCQQRLSTESLQNTVSAQKQAIVEKDYDLKQQEDVVRSLQFQNDQLQDYNGLLHQQQNRLEGRKERLLLHVQEIRQKLRAAKDQAKQAHLECDDLQSQLSEAEDNVPERAVLEATIQEESQEMWDRHAESPVQMGS